MRIGWKEDKQLFICIHAVDEGAYCHVRYVSMQLTVSYCPPRSILRYNNRFFDRENNNGIWLQKIGDRPTVGKVDIAILYRIQ